MSVYQLPDGLPVPVDDGACDHLAGATLPSARARVVQGPVDLAELLESAPSSTSTRAPAGPDRACPQGWDAIPGARGCTPQSCGSATTPRSCASSARGSPGSPSRRSRSRSSSRSGSGSSIPVIADPERLLGDALALPTFEFEGVTPLQAGDARARAGARGEGLLPGLPTRPERGGGGRMARLVTFDEGRVGRVEDDEIVVLDVPTMRELVRARRRGRDGRARSARRARSCGRRSSRRSSSTRPGTSASTRRSRSTSAGRTRSRPGSSSSRTSTRSSGRTNRSSTPST